MGYHWILRWNNGIRKVDKKCDLGIGITRTSGNIVEDYIAVVNRLAELEDKIESGLLVEPPYKLGDRVFGIDEWILNHVGSYRAIKEGTIVYIDIRILAEKIIYHYSIEYFDNIFKVNDTKSRSVCSHVFTTREDAEAKLEELKNK